MREVFVLAMAGALGTVSRHAVSTWTRGWLGERFPWGTLAVNVLGCLLLGFIMSAAVSTEVLPKSMRMPVTVGFFGAFTTMSTFGYETMRYMEASNWWPAMLNVGANLVLCLAATWLGLYAGRAALG